jgi:elongation factor Ts
MYEPDAKTVMELRRNTGAPMMDCKQALKEAGGDFDKAKEVLRKMGKQLADKAASRDVKEGRVFSYVHHNGKIGVLVEIACETDFVAMNTDFQAFGKGVCMTVCAYSPQFLDRNSLDQAAVAKERAFQVEQAQEQMKGKPAAVIDKTVEGRMEKWLAERVLMEKPYVLNDALTVEQVRAELVGKIGENIVVRRFTRLELGG